jgi:hypothetical protein
MLTHAPLATKSFILFYEHVVAYFFFSFRAAVEPGRDRGVSLADDAWLQGAPQQGSVGELKNKGVVLT